MKIDFNSIEESAYPRFKGGEKELNARMFFDSLNRIMYARLVPGVTIGLHLHDTSSEVIFITKGHGHVVYDGQRIDLSAGDVHYCAKGHRHTLINDSNADLEFRAVVSQQ